MHHQLSSHMNRIRGSSVYLPSSSSLWLPWYHECCYDHGLFHYPYTTFMAKPGNHNHHCKSFMKQTTSHGLDPTLRLLGKSQNLVKVDAKVFFPAQLDLRISSILHIHFQQGEIFERVLYPLPLSF
ncbi:hypothetical protein VNO77_08546 [Canavalia gladiata]|uniref:Uncharacterized protein n=1 Tax=Canavalia gladiata TaxID=3824 RepID=A0AAN9QWM7_CANGL